MLDYMWTCFRNGGGGVKQPAENGDYRECLYIEPGGNVERRHDTMSVLSEGS